MSITVKLAELAKQAIIFCDTCSELRRASMKEANAKRDSVSMAEIIAAAAERARLEAEAYSAEKLMFALVDELERRPD
jgi:hypothetical protein